MQPAIRLTGSTIVLKSTNGKQHLTCAMFERDEINGLGVSYFNHALVKWEPLVEPVPVHVEFEQRVDGSTQCVAEVLGGLLINASCECNLYLCLWG
jgi:hypothetical protein